jgi:hypothetical protein
VLVGTPTTGGPVGWWVWSTETAGRTWITARIPRPGHGRAQIAGEDWPVTFSWLTPERGWMMTSLGSGSTESRRQLYTTTNGGRTWRFFDNLPGLGDQGVVFSGPTTGWMEWGGAYMAAPVLDETVNGGQTWQPVALPRPPIVPAPTRNLKTAYEPHGRGLPIFATPQLGAVLTLYLEPADTYDVVYYTTDGGTHWQWVVVARLPEVGPDAAHEAFMAPARLQWHRMKTG